MRDPWRRLWRWGRQVLAGWRPETAVILEIVRECNQRCRYCYRLPEAGKPALHLSPDDLTLVLRRLREGFGRLRLTISGGEPTLHPELPEIVRRCVAVDPGTILITNLGTMTAELARDLRLAGLREIQVTFLSPVPAEHDALCGPGSFDRWIAGLSHARQAGLKAGAILLVTHGTVGRVREALAFLLALDLRSFLVNRYNGGYPAIGGDAEGDGLFLTRSDLEGFLAALEEAGARWNLTIPLGVPIPSCLADHARFPHLEFSACPIGRPRGSYWAVGADGALRACNHLPGALGNLLTTPVAEILAGQAWRELVSRFERLPERCQGCPTASLCRGGCRGAAATWAGTADALDPWVELLLAGPGSGKTPKAPGRDP